jgi:dTDP-4-amino-4,6-dideoxygalactose transaminase
MPTLAISGGDPLRTKPYPGWPPQDRRFAEAVAEVVKSGCWGIGGPRNAEMAATFAAFHDADYAVPCTSGTTALEVALRATGVGYGDEVIVPPYTFIATASSVIAAGAVPVFADVCPETLCLDPRAVEACITPLTRAVIGVHIGGMPCDMDHLAALTQQHGLVLIEDCAQAHGAEYGGRRVGAIGDAGAFSFQSSKNVAAGEGGLVVTDRRDVYERAWSYVNVGRVQDGGWYDHRVFGTNLRLTEMQAALVLRGLELLPEHMDRRDACATQLRDRLDGIPGVGYQEFPSGATRSAWHLFIFRYDSTRFADVPVRQFVAALSAEGIPVGMGYNPLYQEGMFRAGWDVARPPFAPSVYAGHVDYAATHCPVCEYLCTEGSFWMGQSALLASPEDMDDVADAILKVRENLSELEVAAQ